jgi:hypothetical protein
MHNYYGRAELCPEPASAIRVRYVNLLSYLLIVLFIAYFTPTASYAQVASGPITLNGQNSKTLENLHITSTSGNCLTILNSTGITIRNSEIGPCGGNGIVVSGGSGITITDNYIHPESTGTGCCDSGDGIYDIGTTDIQIQGNVVAYGESNIEILNANTVKIIGNFLVNPRSFGDSRGANIQLVQGSRSVVIDSNYTLASKDTSHFALLPNQSDSINMGDGANGVIARNNYISGGFSAYGCGLIADSGSDNIQFLNNTLVDSGQCGIGIEGGINEVVDGNKILNRTPIAGGGNTAIVVFKLYASDPTCGPVTITNNTAYEVKPDGTSSSYWNGGGCSPVTLSGNVFDQAAYNALTPANQKIPAPPIPPLPSACVIASPFSNQTGFPACNGSSPSPAPSTSPSPSASPSSNGPISDGFDASSLDTSLWSFVNPVGDGNYSVQGGDLVLVVPAGSNHDPALGGDYAVRIAQSIGNSDFTVEVKFDSIPTSKYQFQGVVVQQDAGDFLRFNFGSTGSALQVAASKILSGAETNLLNSGISLPGGASSLWLRIQKAGNTWTETWSADGSTYSNVGSFNQALTPSSIGPFAGNYGTPASAAPGFTASVDYFSNTAKPAK